MKKLILNTLCTALFFTLFGCDQISNDCSDIACFTPGRSFSFEILDKTTGEDVFTSGIYSESDIQTFNALAENEKITFSFESFEDRNIIIANGIGWGTEITELQFLLAENEIFKFYVDVERVSEDCCSFSRYNEITLSGADYDNEENGDHYVVYIETEEIETLNFTGNDFGCGDFLVYKWFSDEDQKTVLTISGSGREELGLTSETVEFNLPNESIDIEISEWDDSVFDYFCNDVPVFVANKIASFNAVSGNIKVAVTNIQEMVNEETVYTITLFLENVLFENEEGIKKHIESLTIEAGVGWLPG